MKPTAPGICFAISLLYAVTFAPSSAESFESYDDGTGVGCVQCHTGFQNGNQNSLHFAHRTGMQLTNCDLCHPSGGGSIPVNTYTSGTVGGLGCVGCHGRDYGEFSSTTGQPKASGYGLRQHHANNGVTMCQNCHAAGQLGHPNPLPAILDENVPPPYYGTLVNLLTDPCSSDQEDTSFDINESAGLDNDGDGAVDWPDDPDCSMPTTTTTTTTTTLPLACGAAPAVDCEEPDAGILQVNEKKAGKEKLKVILKKLNSAITQGQFGDPVTGNTNHAICIYDDVDALSTELLVNRAGQQCGTPAKPCWGLVSTKGYKYSDKDASASGIQKMLMKGGDAGKGKVIVKGKNNSAKGQNSLPEGIALLLLDNTQATVQVLTSDAACFGVTTGSVKTADGVSFSAKKSP